MTIPVIDFPLLNQAQSGGAGSINNAILGGLQLEQNLKQNNLNNRAAQLKNQGLSLNNQAQQDQLQYLPKQLAAQTQQIQFDANHPLYKLNNAVGQMADLQILAHQLGNGNPFQMGNNSSHYSNSSLGGLNKTQTNTNGLSSMSQSGNAQSPALTNMQGVPYSPQMAAAIRSTTPTQSNFSLQDMIRNPVASAMQMINNKQALDAARTDMYNTSARLGAWRSIPESQRQEELGRVAGLGLDNQTYINLRSKYLPDQIAQMAGFKNIQEVPFHAVPTAQTLSKIQNTKRSSAVSSYMNPFIADAGSTMSQFIGKWSSPFAKNNWYNASPNTKANYIAKLLLANENFANQLTRAGAHPTQQNLQHMIDNANLGHQIQSFMITPDVMQSALSKFDAISREATNAGNHAVDPNENNFRLPAKFYLNFNPSTQVVMYDKAGNPYPIAKSKVQIALQRGLNYGAK